MEENSDFEFDENIKYIIDSDDDSETDDSENDDSENDDSENDQSKNDYTLLNNSCNNMSATVSPLTLSQYSFDDESQMLVDDDDDDDLYYRIVNGDDDLHYRDNDDRCSFLSDISSTSSSGSKEIKKIQNESISTKMLEQTIMENDNNEDDHEIEISDQQVPIKNINNFKSSLIYNQIEKKSFFSMSSVEPTTKDLNFKSSIDEINCNESFLNSEIESSNDSNIQTSNNIYMISHNNVDYVVNTSDLGNKSLPELFTSESNASIKQSIPPTSKVTQNVRKKRVSKSIPQMQKLPNGKYKMVSSHEIVPPVHFDETFQNRTSSSSDELGHFQQTRQESPGKFSKDKLNNYGNVNKKNKTISHTATSKDIIKHRSLIPSEDCGIKNNEHHETSLFQSDDLTLSNVKRHDFQTKWNTNIKDHGNRVLTNNIELNSDDSNNSYTTTIIDEINEPSMKICVQKKINVNNSFEENAGIIKKLPSEEIGNEEQNNFSEQEENNRSGHFVCCAFQYCDTLVHGPELVNNLYCSSTCQDLDSKHFLTLKETVPEEIKKKTAIYNLKSRIHKRKQFLISPCPEKMARNNNWDELEQNQNSCNETTINKIQTLSNSSCQISYAEAENDDDDEYGNDEDDYDGDGDDNDDDDDNHNDVDPRFLREKKKIRKYINDLPFIPASKKLFDQPFPFEKNYFKVGQKLEGIDPEHEALFCVMTVVEVCGYRIKLHFDGYSDDYNFWVNADCPDLFYPRWCEQNSRTLQPPKMYENTFYWNNYLRLTKSLPAPKWNFASTNNLVSCKKNKFKIGNKLEAIDKLTRTIPKQLICVASVADILGNRIRIHFDGWSEDFDYWTDITSTNIHPVRWCNNNGRILTPPHGYNDFKGKKPFSWTEYLRKTNSKPVPENAFVRRPLRDFAINTTVEVVDLVIPSLIRIAKIVDVRGDELKILYDGFESNYAYWVEDDSPDIHPVGWSLSTNHPIELPRVKQCLWSCRVIGCNGKGNSNSLINSHNIAKDCPYELDSWKKAVAALSKFTDRLKSVPYSQDFAVTSSTSLSSNYRIGKEKRNSILNPIAHNNPPAYKRRFINNKSNEQMVKKNNYKFKIDDLDNKLRKDLNLSILGHDVGPLSLEKQGRAWTRHNAQLGIPIFSTDDARNWSVQDVASYVDQIVNPNNKKCTTKEKISISKRFIDHEIDGESFLMLIQDELMNILKIPLGQALKITNAIIMLRQRVPGFEFNKSFI